MLPDVGCTRRTRQRASVDFPQPDSPTIEKISPFKRSNVTPSTARRVFAAANRPLRMSECLTKSRTARADRSWENLVAPKACRRMPACKRLQFRLRRHGSDQVPKRSAEQSGNQVWCPRGPAPCREFHARSGLPRGCNARPQAGHGYTDDEASQRRPRRDPPDLRPAYITTTRQPSP